MISTMVHRSFKWFDIRRLGLSVLLVVIAGAVTLLGSEYGGLAEQGLLRRFCYRLSWPLLWPVFAWPASIEYAWPVPIIPAVFLVELTYYYALLTLLFFIFRRKVVQELFPTGSLHFRTHAFGFTEAIANRDRV